ncbi:DUF1501 domain-containing protein [Zavarzinella formosa]|uniref:DUF1501 domain-containing protein n=1 Tax=Zavarzinella formosa TaxID=360055 RepID=UPI000303CE3B|nr:DUF1501 domain-containing protein [Zavarzinella formosa]
MARQTNCAGISRRDCLQLGLGSLLGGGLANALRMQATAGESSSPIRQAKSCILIWMDGGPSHYETFDPKPSAPAEYRGEFKAINTKVPGMQFAEHMVRLGAIGNELAVIRSIRHDQGNHGAGNHYMMTGAPPRIPVGCGAFVSFHPSLGSVTASQVEAPAGLPAYFSIPSMTRSGGPNFLGAKYAPFVVADNPNTADFRVRDVALPRGLTGDRFASRSDIRTEVDTFKRYLDETVSDPATGLDQHYRQAYDLMQSKEAQAAFDIQREPDRVRETYGRNPFGQRALLARRLVEAGVPFITIDDGGWDHHTKLFETLKKRLPTWDQTVAALIDDLRQRGLLETTLVIALGEFGRTPQINKDSGRDHWSNAMSVLMAGGGTPGGQVLGATDAKGFAAVERVLSPENFASTVYAKLGIDPGKILYDANKRPVHLVSDPTPIKELMG